MDTTKYDFVNVTPEANLHSGVVRTRDKETKRLTGEG